MTTDDFLDTHLAAVRDAETARDQAAILRDITGRIRGLLAAGAQPTIHDVVALLEREQERRELHVTHVQNTLKGTS